MNENYTREIDLIDLFIDWLSHWKSFLVFLLIGCAVAFGYMYVGGKAPASVEAVVTTASSSTTLSTLSASQLSVLTLSDMEKDFLSQKDITAVDDVIALDNEYAETVQAYDAAKSKMEPKDRAEALSYIASTKNLIETRKAALTPDQQVYYYAKAGVSTVVGETAAVATENKAVTNVPVQSAPSKTKALLIVILAAILHFMIFACRYIFDNTIKHADNLSMISSVPEYTRMVDWDSVNSSKGLDKLIANIKFAGVRRTALSDVVEINASATLEKLKNKNYSSVAIVGADAADSSRLLASQITKADSSKVVKSIDSITHSVNGADEITGVDAAILAVQVRKTRYNEFFEELQSLKDRDVDVIGIAIFE